MRVCVCACIEARITIANRQSLALPPRSAVRGVRPARAAMVVVRGLKALLQRTAPSKLVRSRTGTCYRLKGPGGKGTGPRLVGVAKKLSQTVWTGEDGASASASAASASGGADRAGKAWRGPGGGLRRGAAVDAQVTRCARMSAAKRGAARMLALTRTVAVEDAESFDARLEPWRALQARFGLPRPHLCALLDAASKGLLLYTDAVGELVGDCRLRCA